MSVYSLKTVSRFWGKVDICSMYECWIWKAHKNHKGYGTFQVGNASKKAHRVSWEITNGEIPAGMCVLHTCDVACCVNPFHLFLGTKGDNNRDRASKNRNANTDGEKNPFAKLSDAQVVEILSSYRAGGVTQAELGRKYDVHISTIHLIVRGKAWRHLLNTGRENVG
jgi:Autographiviridae endonuclease